MNHAPAFWKAVKSLCADVDRAEAWLKAQEASLCRFGAEGRDCGRSPQSPEPAAPLVTT
jgi:hypothetical protein